MSNVSGRIKKEWPSWAHSGGKNQPSLNYISIFPDPKVGLLEKTAHTDAFKNLPRSATKPQSLLLSLLIFPGTSLAVEHLFKFPVIRSLSPDFQYHKQVSSAVSFFPPDKLTVCPKWHLYFDWENQPPLFRSTANVTEYGAVFYLSKVFCVFYFCLLVVSNF